MKSLILLRGIPGSGKSTIAALFTNALAVDADAFHTTPEGVYAWRPENAKSAHAWCIQRAESYMDDDRDVVVHNTFTQDWEMKPYFELAEKYGYRVHTLIVENRHGSTSIHNVPDKDVPDKDVLAMVRRFEVRL